MQLLWCAGGKSVPLLDVPEEPAFISGVSLTGTGASLAAQVSTEDTSIAAVPLAGGSGVLAAPVVHEPEFTVGVTLAGKSPTLSATVSAPSNQPQRIGTAAQVNASAGDGSTSITIPVGAHAAVAFFSHWDGNVGSSLASLSLGGNTFSITGQLVEGAVVDNSGVGVALLLNLPAAGDQTLAWTWNGTHPPRSDGGEIVIIWVANIDEGNAIRDFGLEAENTTSNVAVTVDTSTTDLVLAFCQSFGTSAVALDGSVFINNAFLNDHTYDVSQVTPQAGTTTVNMTGESWASMAVISLRATVGAHTGVAALTGPSATLSASSQFISTSSAARTGTASQVNASAGNGNTNITIPATAHGVVAIWSHWDGDVLSTLSSLTLGGTPIQIVAQIPEGSFNGSPSGIGVGVLTDLPASGTQNLVWTWSNGGSRSNGGEIVLVWIRDLHEASPIRDVYVDARVAGEEATAVVDSITTDLVLAFCERFGTQAPTLDGSAFIDNATINNHTFDVTEVSPQAGTTTVNMTGESWSSIAAVSLRPASEVARTATATLAGGSAVLAASLQQTTGASRTATATLTGKNAALSATALFTTDDPLHLAGVTLVGKSAVLVASVGFTESTGFVSRRIIFRVNERFQTEGNSPASASEIANRLVAYVDAVNSMYGKTSSLQFDYNPTTDCIFHPDSDFDANPPQSAGPLTSSYHYAVWLDILLTGQQTSGFGWQDGDEIACGCYGFIAIWSQDDVIENGPSGVATFPTVENDFFNHAFVITHEIGHSIGLGAPEQYFFRAVIDNSGILPDITASASNNFGEYFDSREKHFVDPMTSRGFTQNDVATWISEGAFCPLNTAIIDAYNLELLPGLYGGGTLMGFSGAGSLIGAPQPTLASSITINIKVVRSTDLTPIAGADVFMYDLDPTSFGEARSMPTPMDDNETDANGICSFTWGSVGGLATLGNQARMFKVQAVGFNPNGDWVSCYDVNAKILIANGFHSIVEDDWHFEDPVVIKLTPLS